MQTLLVLGILGELFHYDYAWVSDTTILFQVPSDDTVSEILLWEICIVVMSKTSFKK